MTDKFHSLYKNDKNYKLFVNDSLKDNEKIYDIVQCFEKDPVKSGLSICTNLRVVFIRKGLLMGDVFKTIPINKISSVDIEKNKGIGYSSILVIHTSNDEISFQCRDHEPLMRFYSNLEECRSDFNSNSKSKDNLLDDNDDPLKKIEQLSKLKDQGIITKKEFDKTKKKLLDMI